MYLLSCATRSATAAAAAQRKLHAHESGVYYLASPSVAAIFTKRGRRKERISLDASSWLMTRRFDAERPGLADDFDLIFSQHRQLLRRLPMPAF